MISGTGTLTRYGLAAALRRSIGLNWRDSQSMVESILEEMGAALERGESVKIARFGTFSLAEKSSRSGRNPKTGELHNVPARRVVAFYASPLLKVRVAHLLKDEPAA